MPLVPNNIDAKIAEAIGNSHYLPSNFDASTITHQDDANLYFIDSLLKLDDAIYSNAVQMGVTAPSNPVAGELWFDTNDIELSIFYVEPGKSYGQWVPVFSAATIDEDVSTLTASVNSEISSRAAADALLDKKITNLSSTVTTHNTTLTASVNSLQSQITAINVPDTSNFITKVEEQTHITDLQNQIKGNDGEFAAIYNLLNQEYVKASTFKSLQTLVDTRATSVDLTAVESKIPSLTGYATEAYVTSAIAADTGLSQTGGKLTGTITVDKTDISVPGLNYSTNDWDGRLAQKYQTNCPHVTRHYVTFGTNANLYEYAWDFDDNEDFCWKYRDIKVASIDRNGIAATKLLLADFGNNTSDGRQLTSTIDVGAHIVAQRNALAALRTSAASATTLDELKATITSALANL